MNENNDSLSRRICGDDMTPRDRRNMLRYVALMAAWAAAFLGGMALIERDVVAGGPIGWGLAALNLALAAAVLFAYVRYLREADELQRRIHIEALALGIGGGWLAFAGYRLFELLGAPFADRGSVVVVMAIFYMVGFVLGQRRYR